MTQNDTAKKVLNFLVARLNGSEDNPARFGNVEFWHPVPGFPVGLCYNIPVNKWDITAIQNDLNKNASECWEKLTDYLKEV